MLNDRLVKWLSRHTSERGTNPVPGMSVTMISDVGFSRKENQDRVATMRVNTFTASSKPFVVVALADGMGGMRDGAECAIRALSAFFNALIRLRQKLPKERLELAASIANMTVYEFSKGGGGTTLSALLISADHGAFTLNIGDSRIYATVADGKEDVVTRLTVDDSLEEVVGGSGKELLQFVGMGHGLKPHVNTVPQNAKRILVSSDGVHFIRHESLCDVLLYTKDSTQAAEQLVTLAKWRGAPDNASLAIASLPEVIDSLNETDEVGVEIWDPFSALHVMWAKQEQIEPPIWEEPEKKKEPFALSIDHKPLLKNIITKSKPPKKGSKPAPFKGAGKNKIATTPQLTLEVISDSNKGEDN